MQSGTKAKPRDKRSAYDAHLSVTIPGERSEAEDRSLSNDARA